MYFVGFCSRVPGRVLVGFRCVRVRFKSEFFFQTIVSAESHVSSCFYHWPTTAIDLSHWSLTRLLQQPEGS